jgi:hypothetical protein
VYNPHQQQRAPGIVVVHDVEHRPRGFVHHLCSVCLVPAERDNHVVVHEAAINPPLKSVPTVKRGKAVPDEGEG